MWWSFVPVIGKIIDKVCDIVDQNVEDKDLANKLKFTLKQSVLDREFSFAEKLLEANLKTVMAELQGNWYQRGWRPTLMYMCIFILFNNLILCPYISFFSSGKFVYVDMPNWLPQILLICLGGYMGLRTHEKKTNIQNAKNALDSLKDGIM